MKAKDCTKHWIILRFTSIPLIPLFIYFLSQAREMLSFDRAAFNKWLASPVPSVAVPVFIVCAFYHATLGVDEIFEDYVPNKAQCKALILINRIFFIVLGAASLFAASDIAFGK